MFSKTLVLITSIVFTILVTACGGGGGGGGTQIQASTLTGTAAAGLPILGTVYLKDANGVTVSGQIAADGTYAIDVSDLTPPIRLKAEGTVAGKNVKYYSYASAEDINGTINITPFTDLIIANVAQTLAENFFDGNKSALDAGELARQKTALQTKLQAVFTELGVDSSIDLLTSSFPTNHTGLDGALDILRFETNPEANVVTITNILNNDEITDNYYDDTNDSLNPITTPENSSVTLTDMQKIFVQIDTLNGYLRGGSPSESQMNALVDDNFLQDDMNKVMFVSMFTRDTEFIGVAMQAEISDLNTTTGLADVTLHIYKDSKEIDRFTTVFKRNGTTWLLYGNQKIVEIEASYVCDKTQQEDGQSWVSCGAWLAATDLITTNNNKAGALLSAKVYVERNGTIVLNTTVYLKDNSSGELWPYDGYFVDDGHQDDYIDFGDRFSLEPNAIAIGDKFVFELYNTELNTTDPGAPSVSGTPVQTYRVDITEKPVISMPSDSADFPVFSDATKTQLNTFAGGTLNVEVNNTDELNFVQVLYYAYDGTNQIEESRWAAGTLSATNSFTLDLSSLELTNANFSQELRAYSKASDMQTFMSTYRANLSGD